MRPKIKREAGGNEKIKGPERDPVEDRVDEQALPAEYVLKSRRPGRQDQPEHDDDGNGNGKCGNGMMSDPTAKRVAACRQPGSAFAAKRCGHLAPSPFARKLPERRRDGMLGSLIFVLA